MASTGSSSKPDTTSWTDLEVRSMPPAESGCRPGKAEKGDLPDHPPSSAAKPKTGSAKRLACDNCRERKVRCNREQPVCGRCARLGHNCQYTTPARQNSSHSDVSRLLLTLHSRLQQTEARLALNAPLLDPKHGMNIEPAPNAVDFASFDFMDIQQQQQQQPPPPQQKSSQAPSSQPLTQPDLGYLDNFNLDDPMWQADMDAWGNMGLENDTSMNLDPSSFMFDPPPVALSPISSGNTSISGASDEEIPLQTLKILHSAYFDIAHYAVPIINQEKFLTSLNQPNIPPHVASLSYAIASLGASLMDGYAHVKDKCYQIARKNFEACEREEDGANLMTIEALQACILVTYYELRGKGFARAWMTLGRAIRLAQMMGLDRMDAPEASVAGTLKFQQTLAPAQSPLELEERRKAFWVLFIHDTYASVRSGTPVAIDESKVTTALPAPHGSPEVNYPPMPVLENASILYGTDYISSFTGIVLMVSLCRRCLNHTKLSLESESSTTSPAYSFWEHHYEIDRDLKNCIDAVIGKMDGQALLNDDFALGLDMNFCAIDIFLHEAAIFRAGKDGLPEVLMTESNSRCSKAAMRIVDGVSLSQTLAEPKKALFKQMNIFAMWPVCMAMQVLNRQLSATNDNAELGHVVGMLRILVAAIEDLEDVSGHWIGSISHILKRLEDIDSNSMRSNKGDV